MINPKKPVRTEAKWFRKEEVMRLHAALVDMRRLLESHALVKGDAFREYDSLGTKPSHLHRETIDHVRAVRALTRGILTATRHPAETHRQPQNPVSLPRRENDSKREEPAK